MSELEDKYAQEKASRLAAEKASRLLEMQLHEMENRLDEAAHLEDNLDQQQSESGQQQVIKLLHRAVRESAGRTPPHSIEMLEVDSISFTHDSIAPRFRDGRALEDLVEDLKAGRVDAGQHPNLVLDVVRVGGTYRTLNNRRLW